MKQYQDLDLSIVIVSFRTRNLLRRCLQSVYLNTGCRLEVIVVDNDSDDGSAEMLEREFPAVILVCNEHNLGFAAATNQGFRHASGRYIALLNPDTELMPAALDMAVEFLEADPSVGLVGCQLLNPDGSLQLSAGASDYDLVYGISRMIVRCLLLDKLIGRCCPERVYPGQLWLTPSQHGTTRDVKHVMGACMVVRKEVVQQVGNLDEEYFILMEETDWCYRIRKAGWRIVYLASAKVIHVGRGSMKNVAGFVDEDHIYHLYRGRLLFMRKNKGRLQSWLYRGLLALSISLRLVPRLVALALGIQKAGYRRQVRGLIRAFGLVIQ
jgi:GT2 family glycosyltransferase